MVFEAEGALALLVGRAVGFGREWGNSELGSASIKHEFKAADVTPVDATRHRSVPVVFDLGLTRRAFPRHGSGLRDGNNCRTTTSSSVRFRTVVS
jgi:hypothetical protein